MAECDACGKYENLPYQCRRCGGTFCGQHRLPENHDCPGLGDWNDPSGVFDSGFDDGVENRGRGRGRVRGAVDRATSPGGPLGYFRGNMTFVFLGLMWLTFLAQVVLGAMGLGGLAADLFVLRSARIEYVWTWLTSIFAHGGFPHIALNSIVLYFFGPVVERRLGFKRFVGLFLVAGAVAGLSQVAMGFYFGESTAVVGASGAIMAVMGLLTVLNPGLRVYLYFIIPMPLWVLTIGFAAFSIFAGFTGTNEGVAHFAHLAGLFVGLGYGTMIKDEQRAPQSLRFGGGGGGGGMGGPGRRF